LANDSARTGEMPETEEIYRLALDQMLLIPDLWLACVYSQDKHERESLVLLHEKRLRDHPLPLHIFAGKTIVNDALARQTPIEHHRTGSRAQANYTLGLAHALAVPLIERGQVLGVLLVASDEGGGFQPDSLTHRMVTAIARQTTLALCHAHIAAEERQKRLIEETLRSAVAAASHLQTYDQTLQMFLEHLHRILLFDGADVYVTTGHHALQHRITFDWLADGKSCFTALSAMVDPELYPALSQVIDSGEPDLWVDIPADGPQAAPNAPPACCLLLWPLQQRGRLMGMLALRGNRPGSLSPEHYSVIEGFAEQMARATANARLFTINQEQMGRVRLPEEISTLFSGAFTVSEALDQALTELSNAVDYDTASVMLIEHQTLQTVAWRSKFLQEPFLQRVAIANLEGASRVYQTRAPVLVENTDQSPIGWSDLGNRERGLVVKSWIGAPLTVRGEVIGLLNVDSVIPYAFTQEDVRIVHSLAKRLSVSLENERLLHELTQRNQTLQILNEVIFAANRSLALEPLINIVLAQVLEALKIRAGTIHLTEAGSRNLHLCAAIGLDEETQKTLEIIRDNDPLPLAVNGQSFFTIPFIVKESLLGVLNLLDTPEQPVGQYDSALILNLGDQIAVALENARLYEAALENARRSTELRKLGLAITATLNQQEVLELVARESAVTFSVEGVYIWLVEGDEVVGTHYHDVNGVDRSFFIGYRASLNEAGSLAAFIASQRNPLYINHVRSAAGPVNAYLAEKSDAAALMGVPLLKGEKTLGTIVLVSTTDPDHFNDDYLEQMSLLGVQAALALSNAALFAEAQHRLGQLRLVNDIGRYATGILAFEPLVEGVAQQLYAVLAYDTITLYMVAGDKITVRFALSQGEKIPSRALPQGVLPMVGTIRKVVKSGEAILVSDTALETRITPPQSRSEMVVPLVIGQDVIGVLSVERPGANTIHQEDLDVIQPLAAQLAISIANAQLFEKVQQHNIELEQRVRERTQEIQQQQERIEAILASVADAIVVIEPDGEIALTNPVAKRLFESKREETQQLLRVVERLSRQADRESEEVIEAGPITFQAKASKVMENDEVVGTVIVLRDITRLQEVDRLKSDFVSQVSHELRTPMSNIKLYLSLLRRGKAEKYDTYMTVIEKEAQRLERLIGDLLDISRIDYARRTASLNRLSAHELVDVTDLIEQVILNHTPQARLRQITLRHQNTLTLPSIYANRDQIIQVLTNLVGNAIVYTLEGGVVEVRGYTHTTDSTHFWVVIEVSDTGVGIPEADQARIFERFYRGTTPEMMNPPGTGLGLAITKEIVELHQGRIEVSSRIGEGSCFRVYLPVGTPSDQTEQEDIEHA